jgi:putative flippase GtrA
MSLTAMAVAPASSTPDDASEARAPHQPPRQQRRLVTSRARAGTRTLPAQFLRFCFVGVLNTAIDVLALNALLAIFDLRTTPQILLANAAAYALGAVNSFVLNKHWTFGRRNPVSRHEVGRFALTTLAGIALNDALLWAIGRALLPVLGPTAHWANAAKLGAIGGSVLLSFLGMRLWVFAQRTTAPVTKPTSPARPAMPASQSAQRWPNPTLNRERERHITVSKVLAHHSLSVVLPAYNEERAIPATLADVTNALDGWGADYEVIVVNDGSRDGTGEAVATYAARDPHVRMVTHTVNQGYGAALASGFAAATKDLTFFMDADGQFAIADLALLLVHVDSADAVLGYRLHRQDSWMRLVNAWGWKALVYLALGMGVRDLDCAFKLFRTDFLHSHPATTGGALINAELVYTLDRTGATYREVGVRHLPRQSGRATGARPRVIVRALRDLAIYAWRQRGRAHRSPSSTTA